jgi:tetratricopeptide (TPR) repeat protein
MLALLVAIATIALIARGVLPRIECNRDKGRINRDVRRFARTGDENMRINVARKDLDACRRCLAIYPEDFQLHMLMGATLRILGDADAALQSYETALTIAERPEIYAQMGEIELERGNVEAARKLLFKAGRFHIGLLDIVDEPMRSEIAADVLTRQAALLAARK